MIIENQEVANRNFELFVRMSLKNDCSSERNKNLQIRRKVTNLKK